MSQNRYLSGNLLITGTYESDTLNASGAVYADAKKNLVSTDLTNGQLLIGSSGADPVGASITPGSGIAVVGGPGSITISSTGTGPVMGPANSVAYFNNAGILTGSNLTDGELLIGSSFGPDPVSATITGTANQVIVTNGNGSITLSAPQSIGPGSSPTFANVTDSGLTPDGAVYAGAAGLISSTGAMTDGQLLIGSSIGVPTAATLTGTLHQVNVTNGHNSITLSTPQSIDITSSPTFSSLTLTNPLTVANGGTGDASFTAYSVVCGGTSSTAALQSVASVGSAGQVLTSNGAALLPTFQAVPASAVTSVSAGDSTLTISPTTGAVSAKLTIPVLVSSGGTGNLTNTAYALLCGGTSSTGNLQSATTGTSGQILVSNGAAALPSWTDLLPFNRSSFSPTIKFGGGSTGITYSTQSGLLFICKATNVNLIALAFYSITLSSKGSSTGVATLDVPGGLTIAAASPPVYLPVVVGNNYVNKPPVFLVGGASATTFGIYTGDQSQLLDSNFSNTSTLNGFMLFST
jgi:hypothetical protein